MILLPTLNRINLLTRFLDAAKETETSVPGRIIIDENDYSINHEAYEALESKLPSDWDYVITKAVSMGDKVREAWSKVEHLSAVSIINDDHVPITKHWDKRVYALLNGKNFVSCNDRWNSPSLPCGLTAFSMPLVKAWGFPLFPTGMFHLFIDNVWLEIARNSGCWDVDHTTIVLHKHVFKRESQLDRTHQSVYRPNWQTGPQRQAFEAFMKNEFPEVVKRTIALQLTKGVTCA